MAYHSSRQSSKYNISDTVKAQISYNRYTKEDFIAGMKRYKLVGKTWCSISEVTAKKAFYKSLICAMAAGFSKETVIDIRDEYITLCPLLAGSLDIKHINEIINTHCKDDIDDLCSLVNKVKLSPTIKKALKSVEFKR